MDVFFLMSIFRLYPGFKMSFEHNSNCKNLFLSALFGWDFGLILREVYQNFEFGGNIGYGDPHSKCLIRHFKIFRLNAKLHVVVGAVWANTVTGLGYCYMTFRGANSSLPAHVTWVVFCLYLKLFLPSISNSVDFWSGMFCIVLDIELADREPIKALAVFIDGKFQNFRDINIVLQIKKAHKASVLLYKKFARACVEQWMFGMQWVCKHPS